MCRLTMLSGNARILLVCAMVASMAGCSAIGPDILSGRNTITNNVNGGGLAVAGGGNQKNIARFQDDLKEVKLNVASIGRQVTSIKGLVASIAMKVDTIETKVEAIKKQVKKIPLLEAKLDKVTSDITRLLVHAGLKKPQIANKQQ